MTDDKSDALCGKTALVTGASRRLGREITRSLAKAGANVVVHYHRSHAEALALCEDVQSLGVSAWPLPCDLSNPGLAHGLFDEALSVAGRVDILVNNASVFDEETLWETSDGSLRRNMQLHTLAPLILARAFAGQQRAGHIVNLLDTRVTAYDRKHAAYHISKRSLLTVTRMLAIELAPGIAVNAVAPGLILPPEGCDETYLENLTHTNPLQRHGCPADVTEAVLFLLGSRFITGQIVYVDGGYHMKGHTYD
jgi:NAD(P)-dependent dehydrogenase (short-subunit alcohol dehydrogenase family)